MEIKYDSDSLEVRLSEKETKCISKSLKTLVSLAEEINKMDDSNEKRPNN